MRVRCRTPAPVDLFHRSKGKARRELAITVGSLVATSYGPLPLRIRLNVARLGSGRVAVGRDSGVWVSSQGDGTDGVGLDEEQRSAVARARAEFIRHESDFVPFHRPLGSPLSVEDEESVRSAGSDSLFEEQGTELRLLGSDGPEVLHDSAELLVRRTDLAVLAQVPSYRTWCEDTERALRERRFL